MKTMYSKITYQDAPKELIENSIKATFGANKASDYYKYDFMWVAHDEDMRPQSFVLCSEVSNEKVWLAYGGTIPDQRGMKTIKNFKVMLDDLLSIYPQVGAQVENTNYPMLKIYLAHEFKIVGTRLNHEGRLFVEFFKEREVKKEIQNG